MYVDRSRNVYTDASYADRERFSLSRRRVRGIYTGEKETERGEKKEKNAVSNMANGSLFSQRDNDNVWGSFESRRWRNLSFNNGVENWKNT